MRVWFAMGILALMRSLASCRDHTPAALETHVGSSQTEAGPAPNVVDRWLGRWDGPEGTFLLLSKAGDKYVVEIQDLDGPKTFEGVADGDRVRFVRDGTTEFIFANDGEATGMKWLSEKGNCLMTKYGEGWCRN